MASKYMRVIGTTIEAIRRAEAELRFTLPPSFRDWLLTNNGLGIEGVTIFPIFDDRDPRKTWDSIVRQYSNGDWAGDYFDGDELDFSHLLPFGDFGNGDYYCFDYRIVRPDGEIVIVLWSHETGETEVLADTFDEFVARLQRGDFADH